MQKDGMTAETVRKLLCKQGKEITLEQAQQILDFLRKMANIVIASHLNRDLEGY